MDEFLELDQFYNEFFHIRHMPRPALAEDTPTITVCDMDDEDEDEDHPQQQPAQSDSQAEPCQETFDPQLLVEEESGLHQNVRAGCGCAQSCFASIDVDIIINHIYNIREMDKDAKDMYLMGALHKIGSDPKRSRYGERKRTRYEYKFEGNHICRKAFLMVYDIGEKTLKNLIRHVSENGNVPRIHGNKGKKPRHALAFGDIEKVVKFIVMYANENGLPQPAAPRGRDDIPPVFLPASTTKVAVHRLYEQSCQESDSRAVKISGFWGIWSQCCSHIKIATPENDVCAKCEMLRKKVSDARTDDDKLQTSMDLQQHVLAAKMEHQVYKTCVANSKDELRGSQPPDTPAEACSQDYAHVHYTFDFSQNVAVPHHVKQMGPMYFVTPRKVHLFGFRDDGTPRQYNYMIDESQTMEPDGKGIHGPDAIISMVDHALSNYTRGEKTMTIHADNCGGQNKNRYVLAYFSWRTLIGLNQEIRYFMQLPGHARCLIDAGFATIKKLYRRSDCETLADIGLTTEGCLCVETDEDKLCVKLYQVTFQCDGGCLLAPLNRDLKCVVNSTEELNREINLIHGMTLEIAEKRIVYIDGSVQRRRHLPATPGQSRDTKPPPKPARASVQNVGSQQIAHQPEHPITVHNDDADDEESDEAETDEKKWLSTANIMLDLPPEQQDKLNDLKTPEQISILAASYFTKQLRMFTDAVVTGELIDDIFRLFSDTVSDCHDSYMVYLSSVSHTLTKVPDRTQHLAIHRPAVRLATDLLRSCFDPISRVILILGLLRTFSHFDKNLHTMIRLQTTATVIGSMTAFNKTPEVQQHGLDILSKIATYAPKLGEKPQLKEVGIEQVIRGVKQHPDHMNIGRAACRVFANLSSTLISLLNQWIDTDVIDNEDKFESLERIEKLLEFVFTEGIPVAQGIVEAFSQDLGVKMDFRRFVFFYAKHQHFRQKKMTWLSQQKVQFHENTNGISSIDGLSYSSNSLSISPSQDSPEVNYPQSASQPELPVTQKIVEKIENQSMNNTQTGLQQSTQSQDVTVEIDDHSMEESPQGILKKSRSYECLRTSERKLNFDTDTIGGSDSETTSSDTDSSSSFELHGPFEPEIPLEVDMEDDFSFHLVQHLVKKTVKRQKSVSRHRHYSDTSSSETDESDKEFFESMNYSAQTKGAKAVAYMPENIDVKTATYIPEKVGAISNLTNADAVVNETECAKVGANAILTESEVKHSVSEFCVKDVSAHEEGYIVVNGDAKLMDYSGDTAINGDAELKDDTVRTGDATNPGPVDDVNVDVYFKGKLVQTQITVHVISMVFQGEDSQALQLIDQPILLLLHEGGTSRGILQFAENQYGDHVTLMDLEPGLVIRIIDAVRYRTVALDLLHSALFSLTKSLSSKLQPSTVDTAMVFYKTLFSNPHLHAPLTEDNFLKKFRECFQNASGNLGTSSSVEELCNCLLQTNFVI